jgi:hypothetical protein
MCSVSESSTQIHQLSAPPCTRSRHSNAAVSLSVIRSTVRVIGCAETSIASAGSAAASARSAAACRWFEINSPSSRTLSSRSASMRAAETYFLASSLWYMSCGEGVRRDWRLEISALVGRGTEEGESGMGASARGRDVLLGSSCWYMSCEIGRRRDWMRGAGFEVA